MSEIPMMKCDWCGKEFPADARACQESGLEAEFDTSEDWKNDEEGWTPTPEEWEKMKADLGLDDDQLHTLLSTGKLDGLGSIVCLQCQDDAHEQQHGFRP